MGCEITDTSDKGKGLSIYDYSITPGNCFSCKYMRKFTPLGGEFECSYFPTQEGSAMLSANNIPPENDCKYWEEKKEQKILSYDDQSIIKNR